MDRYLICVTRIIEIKWNGYVIFSPVPLSSKEINLSFKIDWAIGEQNYMYSF